MDLKVTDNLYEARYEAQVDGEIVGVIEYELTEDDLIILIHTDVLPTYQDHGVGGAMARQTLDDIRRRGLRVRVVCPFMRGWLERHAEYEDLIG